MTELHISETSSSGKTFAIRCDWQFQRVTIEPPCPELDAVLRMRETVTVDDVQHGYRMQRATVPLLSNPRGIANAGLQLVVGYALLKRGHKARLTPPSKLGPRNLPSPLPAVNPHVCEFVAAGTHGMIRHHLRSPEVFKLLIDMAQALRDARIAFVAKGPDNARRLHSALEKLLGKVTLALPNSCLHPGSQLTVATPYGLGHPDMLADPIDILVFLDPAAAVQQSQDAIVGHGRCRLFGLLRDDKALPPRVEDLLMAAFGPEEVSVPRLGFQRRPIELAWLGVRPGPPIRGSSAGVIHREGIVRHRVRNRRIAALARAIEQGDEPTVRRLCPLFPDAVQVKAGITTIVASDVDHAIQLARRLPGYDVVIDESANLRGLTPTKLEQLAGARKLFTQRWIVTVAALRSFHLGSSDTVIWAAAGSGLPPVRTEELICPAGNDRALLWIDCGDEHHHYLKRRARSRREAYLMAGWVPAGDRGTVARIEQFLSRDRRG